MKMRAAVAAALGAALLAVGTGAVAHAQLDGNTTGDATSTQTAIRPGTNHAQVDGTITASGGGNMKNRFTAKNGNADVNNRNVNRTGTQRFKIG